MSAEDVAAELQRMAELLSRPAPPVAELPLTLTSESVARPAEVQKNLFDAD
jgi:hypothetical protein